MKIHVFRNRRTPDRPWFFQGRLPINQRLIWVGNWFILVQGRRTPR